MSQRSGTVPFDNLIEYSCNSLPGENMEDEMGPKHPEFIEADSRIQTFSRMSSLHSIRIYDLVHSGFFYTGETDTVQCFSCGVRIKDWRNEHDPWVEHAWWSPDCRFIQESRSRRFVDEVQRRAVDLNGLPIYHKHTSIVVTGRRREISLIEAKFQEGDVLLALKKFLEQRGRRPNLTEFFGFINNWEEKLIEENVSLQREKREMERVSNIRIQDLERKLQELMMLRGQ